jgi:tetratricopeptide (TPR) repeat protein
MDLTTLAAAIMVALGLMAADATLSSDKVIVDVAVPESYTKAGISTEIVEALYLTEIQHIIDTPSVVPPPAIHGTREKSLSSSLAETLKLGEVGAAVQRMMGYNPTHIRASVIVEQETTKFIVVETTAGGKSFEITLEQRPDETVVQLIKRGALETMFQLEPYLALVHALQTAQTPAELSKVRKAIKQRQEKLPNTPLSTPRSQYENLRGIIALLDNDVDGAAENFGAAAASDPRNVVALLNLGFLECQRDHNAEGERIIRRIIEPAPLTRQPVLLAAAYMTWACNLMGMKDFKRADFVLAQSILVYPQTSSAYELWADLKEETGNAGEAQQLRRKARENSIYFENFAEVAMLYFELSWREKESLRRSRHSNPNLPQPLMNQP